MILKAEYFRIIIVSRFFLYIILQVIEHQVRIIGKINILKLIKKRTKAKRKLKENPRDLIYPIDTKLKSKIYIDGER